MKSTVALVFGGKSPEHAISLRSARNIFAAIPRDQYDIVLIAIDEQGRWYHLPESAFLSESVLPEQQGKALCLIPGQKEGQIQYVNALNPFPQIDLVFPITHGPYGEDGSLQGLLRHLELPFVGPDVLGSAASMDKDVCKRLLREADLLTAEYYCFRYFEKDSIDYQAIVNRLGSPLFIKPANMGSSVGVHKAENAEEFRMAVADAFKYDHKIIVEEAIYGRELECAVLGNGQIEASDVGEVVTASGLYDYESKYLSEDAAKVLIPAENIDPQMRAKLIQVAQSAYRCMECEGMTRVDMFLCDDGRVYVNELNTLPGFTSISMYPKLWEAAGLSYSDLIDRLLKLAQERQKRTQALQNVL